MRRTAFVAVFALVVSACLSSANLSGAPEPESETAQRCAADVKTDVGNCGTCGKVCANQANAFAVCKEGQCGLGCNTGFADCNTKAEDGCETMLATDSQHCGACGHSCAGGRCVDGQCQPVVLATLTGSFSSPEKARTLDIRFTEPSASASASDASRNVIVPIVLGGVGVASLGVFAVYHLSAKSDLDDMRDTCAPRCSADAVDALDTKIFVSNLALGIGISALAAAAFVHFTRENGVTTRAAVANHPLVVRF